MTPQNSTVVLYPKGRIDSSNAQVLQRELTDALTGRPDASLILDFDGLDYISSAGLRVLLSAAKRSKTRVAVRNASPEVYDILDMTGFTSILRVERRLRSIDISGCGIIARGGTGTVYRIDRDTVVKVYEIPDALGMIKTEQQRAKQAFLKGIPTAISYDAVRVGDRFGSVFELVNAKTFTDLLAAEPSRLDELVRKHVEVIKTIHNTLAEPDELPDSRDIYRGYLQKIGGAIPQSLRGRILSLLSGMPEDLHLIHGDAHMKNVMLSDGEPLFIDMETLGTGNPVFDLADLFIAYRCFNEDDPENSLRVIGLSKDVCAELFEKTLACYFGPDDPALARKRKRIMAVGYIRFLYLVAGLRLGGEALVDVRIRHAVGHLDELLGEIDGFAV